MRPFLIDLYCCQGGAGDGYQRAGFDVLGVDIEPQPRNPHDFHQRDAIAFLQEMRDTDTWDHVDAIHASPPCQLYSKAHRIRSNTHPDLIGPTRELLQAIGKPYVIENVPGAPLIEPVELCGSMFGLRLYRHRLFETNWPLTVPLHPAHMAPQVKMGRVAKPHEMIQPVGNFSGVQEAREVMDMPWASREGLREAIPPAYTEYIGVQLMDALAVELAA